MIYVDNLPCSNCKNFQGVKQPDGQEIGEFVGCKIAKEKDAKNLLIYFNNGFSCDHQIKLGE